MFRYFKRNWSSFPVSKKLYSVVGLMVVVVAFELAVLLFTMNTFTALRALVYGEGMWSKAQKNSVLALQNYARTRDISYFYSFNENIGAPLGSYLARKELEKVHGDSATITEGLIRGGSHPLDAEPIVDLLYYFQHTSYIKNAMSIWTEADENILELMKYADQLHALINSPNVESKNREIDALLIQISELNTTLTTLENRFSSTLGDASRWIESRLRYTLFSVVFSVGLIGFILTFFFGRTLSRSVHELKEFAKRAQTGDFSRSVNIHSGDEIGQLALAFNKMAKELKDKNSETIIAERSNKIKSMFLANVSHEIRTPLNALLGFVELLRQGNITQEERTNYLEIIDRTGKNLSTIINDILDISKIEAGKISIKNNETSIEQIICDVRSMVQLSSQEKNIKLNFQGRGLIPKSIWIDGTRLKQILLNIVGNAIKFTSSGEVTVTYQFISNYFYCWVKDTGVGIEKFDLNRLFNPFSQLDSSYQKNYSGTGLGLTLSKRLAKMMGGDVVLVSSKPNVGSTFLITVAAEFNNSALTNEQTKDSLRSALESASDKGHLRGKRVLLVEDSYDNQLLTKRFLQKLGVQVEIANNGKEGVSAALASDHDLVLMDIQMPIMDGFSATSELRAQGYKKPIIALTATAMKEDLDRCKDMGCNNFITKPVRYNDFVNILNHYIS